jgi:hypothetical protein
MADPVVLSFDWTPKSVPLSFTAGGNTYPYSKQVDNVTRTSDGRYAAYTTPANTLLTFTATAIAPGGVVILEYKWDFGDGTIGYGSSVAHTYTVASYQTQATLVVTDSLNRRYSRAQVLNLRPAAPIQVSLGARV